MADEFSGCASNKHERPHVIPKARVMRGNSKDSSCLRKVIYVLAVPVAARSKAWVCGRSPAEIVGLNLAGGHGCLSVVSVVCCQVEVSAMGRSVFQRSPTERVCVCVCV